MKSTGFSSSYHPSSPSNSFTYVPDETALTLFKRVQLRGSNDKVEGSGIEIVRPLNNSPSLHIRTGINHIQEFKFNESVELQGYPSEVPEVCLLSILLLLLIWLYVDRLEYCVRVRLFF